MKKRFLSFVLCIMMILSSVPLTYLGADGSFAVSAAAVNTQELVKVYESVPPKSQWDELFVDYSALSSLYDEAKKIIDNPSKYTQNQIDSAAHLLQIALDNIEYHTQGISLNKTKLTLAVGKSATLKATTDPKNAADKITWSSSDSSVVSVDGGVITAKKYSKSAVTITASSNGHKAKCSVTISNPLSGVKLSLSSKTIYDNGSFSLTATAIGKDSSAAVTDEVIYTWDSSNEKVASVSDTGKTCKVSGASKGTATITVIASCGSVKYSAVCKVTVKEIVLVTGFKALTLTNSGTISKVIGESETFRVQVLPSTASVKTLKWTSSNTKVATVSAGSVDGDIVTGKIKAVGAGSATITYTATDGSNKKGSFKVKVLPLVSSLSISETVKVISLDTSNAKLKVTVSPSNAGNQVVDWSTSNSSVCTVDRNGVLTPKAKGTCTITAKTTDSSGITVSCKLRVAPKSSAISLNKTSLNLNGGSSASLTATVRTVENTTYTGFVEWISENSKIASVDKNGKVTANYPGTVKIKAVTTDGTNRSAACVVTVKQPVLGVSLPSKKNVNLGSTVTLKPTFKPTYAENQKVTWSSSDKSVATVSSSGVVTAKKVGTCKITVKTADGGYTASCTVTVVVPTKSIKLSKTSASVKAGSSITLTATVSPSNASNKTVKWTSSNTKVATVSSKGVVKGIAGGKCTITATASGGQTAKCTVSVSQALESITLNKKSLTLYATQTYQLKKTLKPSTTTAGTFTWTSSNTKVAKVSSSGVVTAVSAGTATITVSCGAVKASCSVKVTKKISVTGVKIAKSAYVSKGRTITLDASVSPSNASNKALSWSSSNKNVATVSSSGVVKGIKAGNAVITVKTKDGGYTAKCTVSVSAGVTGIRISDDSIKLSKGRTKTLTVVVLPLDAVNQSVKWTSSDTSVAKVNQSGVVTAVNNGSCMITATTVDGGFKATCSVTVYNVTTGIKLDASKVTVAVGSTKVLNATVLPSNATNKTVKWSSSDKSIVSVNSAGQITAKRKGAAVITAKTADGDHKTTCTVTVVRYATGVVMDYSSVTINAGSSKMLYARVQPSTASNTKIKWSSSNTKVVKVDSDGKITAVAGGNATVKATSGDGKAFATCKITVLQKVSKITLSPSSLSVGIGGVKIIKATISPKTATNQSVTWSSSNTKIATVDADGVVKGIAKGTADITAKSADGDIKAVCKVNVTKAVTGVKLNKSVISMKVGQKTAVTASVIPSSANNHNVTWSTNNYDVATVSSDGVVMAKGPGYAEITAKTKDGGYKAVCKVNVIQPVKSISLSAKSKTLDIASKYTLKASINPKNASDDTVKWSSSNTKVAKVNSSGVVTAVSKGTATITAKSNDGGFTAKCTVKVVRKVKSVSLNKTSLKLYLDKTATLKATVSPSDASNKKITWKSSNTSVVKVSSSGKLTPVKAGTATITVKTNDGGKTAKCTVKVEKAVKTLTLSKSSLTLASGKSYTLKATVSPSDATNKTITWSSSNKNAATVSSSGVVKAVAGGKTTITAKTSNGISKTCVVTVTQSVSSVKVSKSSLNVYVGETYKLSATVSPSTATNKTVSWSSSNSKVASVSSSGTVTAKAPGEAVITVKTADGAKTAKCTITVKRHVKSVSISPATVEIAKGKTLQLKATISPSDATDKTVVWSSSDKKTVSVSSTGKITALSVGDATISVKTTDGSYRAECKITVFEPVTGLDIDVKTKTVYTGKTFKISAVVSPSDATNKTLVWKSSNSLIASVSSDGTVKAVKAGTATISVATVDGGFKQTCSVTVLQKSTGLVLSNETLNIETGETKQLSATVLPDDASNKTITWESSNSKILKVDSTGKITALLPGEADVTAKTADGITQKCKVTVIRMAQEVVLSQSSAVLYKGGSLTLNAVVLPDDTSNKAVTWKSSNKNVATVSNGVVQAIGKGTAVITAVSADGKAQSDCKVEVLLAAESITTDKEKYIVPVGDSLKIQATVLPEDTADKTLLWSSDNEKIVSVSSEGTVTAVSAGTANITIKAAVGGAEKTVSVFAAVPETSVKISGEANEMFVSDCMKLQALISPENADYKDVTWSSDNEAVLKVSSDGTVSALSAGQAKVKVVSHFKKAQDEFVITVKQGAEEIKLSKTSFKIDESASIKLEASVLPENADNKQVQWQSSNEDVATVDQNGLVSAVSKGTALITVTSKDGRASAVCKIEVQRTVKGIELSQNTAVVENGKTLALSAVVTPADATDTSVKWLSSNDDVAVVSENGVVTAVSAGNAQIIAQSSNESVKAVCNVTVEVYSTGVKIQNSKDELWVGETLALSAVVSPSDTTDKSVTFKSSDSSVASVSESGVVTAIKDGTAKISVTTNDTGKTASFDLKVSVKETSVSLSKTQIVVQKGETFNLDFEVLPENATYKQVTWQSSDEKIVSIGSDGSFKAEKVGTATITIKTAKNFKEDTCTVKIIQNPQEIVLDKTSVSIDEKGLAQLEASFVPSDTTQKDLIWASSDESIAVVENGVITGVSKGTAEIYAISKADGNVKATCTVEVKRRAQGISFDCDEKTVKVSESFTLRVTITPEGTSEQGIIWTTSDDTVVSVGENGNLKAVGKGSATIYAQTVDGGYKAFCMVTVE
ncbi:MAG: Ig-like domain-containing protein [Acutalibacteraceae bacterium]